MIESVIIWTLLGVVAGALASSTSRRPRPPMTLDILVGVVGALLGGWVFKLLGLGIHGFNLWSLVVAVAGAVALLGFWHLIGLSIGLIGLAAGLVAIVLVLLHLDATRRRTSTGEKLTFRDRCNEARLHILRGIAIEAERLYDRDEL